jgi:hypothetical protein
VPDLRRCPGADHRPPPEGGSCACGMVTRVPARRSVSQDPLRQLLQRALGEDVEGRLADDGGRASGSPSRTDRVLAALDAAGLLTLRTGEPVSA